MSNVIKAGRELDALVAEKVMGWKHGVGLPGGGCMPADAERMGRNNNYYSRGGTYPFFYHNTLFREDGKPGQTWSPSTDIADAWLVVEKITGDMIQFRLVIGGGIYAKFVDCRDPITVVIGGAHSTSAAHAICLAALKAIHARVK